MQCGFTSGTLSIRNQIEILIQTWVPCHRLCYFTYTNMSKSSKYYETLNTCGIKHFFYIYLLFVFVYKDSVMSQRNPEKKGLSCLFNIAKCKQATSFSQYLLESSGSSVLFTPTPQPKSLPFYHLLFPMSLSMGSPGLSLSFSSSLFSPSFFLLMACSILLTQFSLDSSRSLKLFSPSYLQTDNQPLLLNHTSEQSCSHFNSGRISTSLGQLRIYYGAEGN